MARPETHIRPDDTYKITRQKIKGEGAPEYSVVCRLLVDDVIEQGNEFIVAPRTEHLYVGRVSNPGQWARWARWAVDNPPPVEAEESE